MNSLTNLIFPYHTSSLTLTAFEVGVCELQTLDNRQVFYESVTQLTVYNDKLRCEIQHTFNERLARRDAV